jgi:hypothetical protein
VVKKTTKAKVTSLADFKKQQAPTCSIEDLLGVMKPLNPLGVSSEKDIIDKMKASGDPTMAAFANDLERQMNGENVDLRKYSDL